MSASASLPRAMFAGAQPASSRWELAIDRVIDGRYRVIEPIGLGGSSQVYLAHDAVLARHVAIKVLDEQAAGQAELRRLFTKEARALAQLSHPNIVGVFDVGEVDGRPYIAMEHVAGVSLKQRIERAGALAMVDTLRLGVDIAKGLDFAHSRGIIHADLKPSNVLLDQDDRPKICDFGIARTPQDNADSPQLFATAMYVSPERIEGKRASAASDIYGLGLVIYEMLVGKPPFTSTNAAVLLRDHVVRQPVPPSHLRPSLPKELDAVVMKALAKDPAARWGRASEMAAALEKIGDLGATTQRFIAEPIHDFVPKATQSPVVHLLSTYGTPIRNAFFGALTAAPVLGLALLAGLHPVVSLVMAGLVGATSLLQLGIGLAVAWLMLTALIFMFVPALALLFAGLGVVLWVRDVKPEQTALAIAMPVAAPFGLAPALVLSSAALHGLGGVITVAWGGVLTTLFAIAAGRQSLGPFAQTGLSLEQASLFSLADAAAMRSAFLRLLQPSNGEGAFAALATQLAPERIVGQLGGLVSRIGSADVTALANILAWIVGALVVWTVTRVLRASLDTILKRRAWFGLYVFATALGVCAGAALLYMLYLAATPLSQAPGRTADGVLLLSAITGALLALAIGVVISATEPHDVDAHEATILAGLGGGRLPVR